MNRRALLAIPPALFLLLIGALPAVAGSFDGERAVSTVREIASDGFQGRKSGLEGGRMIEEYVAARFEEWGLTPAGRDGSRFHGFDLLVTEEQGASMTLLDGPHGPVEFPYGDDFALITNSGSGDVTAEVVLVGHGLSDADREWDDYGDVDVEGKIVVILRGNPDNGFGWGEAATRDSTLHEAVRRGAAGILFSRARNAVNGAAIHDGSYFPDVPMAQASKRILDHLLVGTGWDLKRYQKELKDEPVPFPTGKRLRFRAEVSELAEGRARNVVGMVEGADPVRRSEIVVIGGHMDHVGVNGDGLVYNGANDNGSGTSVVMELARTFATADPPPARTLVFVTFAGEEQGLLGSEAFVEDPCLDLDRVVAMLNFDMVGHGDGTVGIGGGEYYPELRAAFGAGLDSARADSLTHGRAWGGASSDHGPFRVAGIPVWNVWSAGDHRFYHTVQDESDWVEASVLGSVGRMAEGWIGTLANWPEPLLVEHRDGRSLLQAAIQIDFSGPAADDAPVWVAAGVDWSPAAAFAGEGFLDELADLKRRAADDEISVVHGVDAIRGATSDGKRAAMVGLSVESDAGVAESRRALLQGLDVSIARWSGASPPDSATTAAFVDAGAVLLLSTDPDHLVAVPEGAKRCIRFFPGRGESVAEPDSLPRKHTLFVVAVEGSETPDEIAGLIDELGWYRVHLDVVPWRSPAGDSPIHAFLEELQAAAGREQRHMAAILGGNLGRL